MSDNKNIDNISNFVENLYFISSVANYNTERIQLAQKFYDHANRTQLLSNKKITIEDIKEFGKDENKINIKSDGSRQSLLEEAILTMPGDIHVGWNLSYIAQRYNHLENAFYNENKFYIVSLAWLEKVIRDITIFKETLLNIQDCVYQFKTKDEYANPCFLTKPTKNFQEKWSTVITFSEEEIIEAFINSLDAFEEMYRGISGIRWKLDSLEEYHQIRKKEALNILKYLSRDLYNYGIPDKWDIFHKPLIKLKDDDGKISYFVPFPHLIGSTTQFRVEDKIKNSKRLEKIEQKNKGKIVELLVRNILGSFPNKNIIKNFSYKIDSNRYESDILLILDKSLWVVEIKSHPLLRKIPDETNKIIPIYVKKIKEGIKQAQRTINYLFKNREFLFHLNCDKKLDKYVIGTIIILDSFFPIFITNNKLHDTIHGTYEIYEKINPSTRLSVFTLLDLYLLSPQFDKEVFEDYLIWKTSHLGKFPIITFDEPDKWAFYNNHFLKNHELRKAFDIMVKQEMSVIYNSYRFNDKKYLKKLVKNEP